MGACPGGRGGCCGGRAGSLSVDIAMCDTSDKSHGKDQVLVEGLCVCVSVVQGGECPLTHPLAWSPPGAVTLFILVKDVQKGSCWLMGLYYVSSCCVQPGGMSVVATSGCRWSLRLLCLWVAVKTHVCPMVSPKWRYRGCVMFFLI